MKDQDDSDIVLKVEADPLIGRKLADRYGIVSVIGRGGMGVVYKAKDLRMERFVAIKTLHLGKIGDATALKKFQSEAQAVSKVRHPHTVGLYDFGFTPDGQPFLVMEYVQGVSFRQVLKDDGPLPLARVEHIFNQVVDALSCAHEHGIVHKDLKPENIMLANSPGKTDWVYVLDFGIAGFVGGSSRPGENNAAPKEAIGSPPYMSPEQCSMHPAIDHRTDIYALGICAFEALAGSGVFPYKARTAMEVMDCHINHPARPLREVNTHTGTYESVTQVINKALEKQPDKRQINITEFGKELSEAVQKDARRGLQLKDRIELDRPRTAEFVNLKKEVIEEMADEDEDIALAAGDRRQYFASKQKGIFETIKAMFYGDQVDTQKASGPTYTFTSCPHCGADTQEGLALCLSCGRSLAARDDFSKLRAARGEFSLPKHVDKGGSQTRVTREVSLRTRSAMQKTGRAWTRHLGPLLLSVVLIVVVFIMSGGMKMVESTINPQSTPTPASDNELPTTKPNE